MVRVTVDGSAVRRSFDPASLDSVAADAESLELVGDDELSVESVELTGRVSEPFVRLSGKSSTGITMTTSVWLEWRVDGAVGEDAAADALVVLLPVALARKQ